MKKIILFLSLIILFSYVHSQDDFMVGPGDRITIAFQASRVNSFAQSRISDNGYLPIIMSSYDEEQTLVKNVKYLTSIKANNLTVKQLEREIESAIKEFYKDASVTVLINSMRYSIHLIGNENDNVTSLKYIEGMTVWEYISNSTMFSNHGVIAEVILITRKGEKIKINSDDLYTYVPDWGASIFIPKQYVFVEGGISNPGGCTYVEDKRAEYYIGISGGKRTGDVNANKGYIIRAENGEKVSIKDNPPVYVNDRIILPQPRLTLSDFVNIVLNIGLAAIAILF